MDPPASRRNEARLLIATEEGSHVLRERTERLLRHEGEGCLHRGKAKVTALFTFTCAAYNLVRLRTLLAEPSSA
jgi:hypothetical protein